MSPWSRAWCVLRALKSRKRRLALYGPDRPEVIRMNTNFPPGPPQCRRQTSIYTAHSHTGFFVHLKETAPVPLPLAASSLYIKLHFRCTKACARRVGFFF